MESGSSRRSSGLSSASERLPSSAGMLRFSSGLEYPVDVPGYWADFAWAPAESTSDVAKLTSPITSYATAIPGGYADGIGNDCRLQIVNRRDSKRSGPAYAEQEGITTAQQTPAWRPDIPGKLRPSCGTKVPVCRPYRHYETVPRFRGVILRTARNGRTTNQIIVGQNARQTPSEQKWRS